MTICDEPHPEHETWLCEIAPVGHVGPHATRYGAQWHYWGAGSDASLPPTPPSGVRERYLVAPNFEAMQYLGFDQNGREVEVWLGAAFETHIPSADQLVLRASEGEVTVSRLDWIVRPQVSS